MKTILLLIVTVYSLSSQAQVSYSSGKLVGVATGEPNEEYEVFCETSIGTDDRTWRLIRCPKATPMNCVSFWHSLQRGKDLKWFLNRDNEGERLKVPANVSEDHIKLLTLYSTWENPNKKFEFTQKMINQTTIWKLLIQSKKENFKREYTTTMSPMTESAYREAIKGRKIIPQ